MKKLLLASVAVSGLALAAAPAHADIDLELGGYFSGYGVYQDNDTDDGFDIVRDTELHVGGESTLDNGLTVGFHLEFDVDQADSNASIDESYLYFSGDWGRVNLGAEEGATYLLQVAAPSADSSVDGLRALVSPFSTGLDYDHDTSGDVDKITYLTPVFSGFQAGISYAANTSDAADTVDTLNADSIIETAVRYEGEFEGVGVIAGAGYSRSDEGTTGVSEDAWNVGLDLDIAAFGVGAVYLTEDFGTTETDTMVVGADYTTGPFKIGASYLNIDDEGANTDTDRYTGGVTYKYAPGMSFRGSVSYTDEDVADTDATAVMIGTRVSF